MLPLYLAAALLVAGSPPLTLEDLTSRARPSAEELELEAELAAVRHALAATGSRLAEGPTLAAGVGPRRTDDETELDLGVELELTLLAGAARRAELAQALESAAPALLDAARAERRARVIAAYLDLWLAQRTLEIRRLDVELVERWRGIARRRLEGGALPAFEVDLLDLELDLAETAQVLAQAGQSRAWAELAAVTELAAEPVPVSPPSLPFLVEPGSRRERFEQGVLARAVAAELSLASAQERLGLSRSQSRLSLRSALEREGEEEVASVGLAYRFPRRGEAQAASVSVGRRLASLARQAELAKALLRARFEAASLLVSRLGAQPAATEPGRALAALELQLLEGKASASEVLPSRRSLLALELARAERQATLLRAAYELELLTSGGER